MKQHRYILLAVGIALITSRINAQYTPQTAPDSSATLYPSPQPGLQKSSPPSGTDIRVFPSTNKQAEFSIAISPINSSKLLIGGNVQIGTIIVRPRQGYYYSADGGLTWAGGDSLPQAGSSGFTADPAVAFDAIGNAYYSYMDSGPNIYKIRVKKSLDGGATWQPYVQIPNAGIVDKPHMVTSG